MKGFPQLRTSTFTAFIADNTARGIHRAGYNGVAALIPHVLGNNIFVPFFAGMNYEHIWLEGLEAFKREDGFSFEPRVEPMEIESADDGRVVLVQPETSYSHVSARITFSASEPHSIDQSVELTFHRRFCGEDRKYTFRSLFASYMHAPPDRHVYLRDGGIDGEPRSGWYGYTKPDHGSTEVVMKALPDDLELTASGHLESMQSQDSLPPDQIDSKVGQWQTSVRPARFDGPLPFYYGLYDKLAVIMMFRQPERVRFAYSPCGAGKQPQWNPAWDYVLYEEDVRVGESYTWDIRLAVKPFESRADVLDEVRGYQEG